MRVRAMVVTLDPDKGRGAEITELVTVELPEYSDADWYLRGDDGHAVHQHIRARIGAVHDGELVGYALLPARGQERDDRVRALALIHLDDDRLVTAAAIADWPDAAKELVLVLGELAGECDAR